MPKFPKFKMVDDKVKKKHSEKKASEPPLPLTVSSKDQRENDAQEGTSAGTMNKTSDKTRRAEGKACLQE